MKKVFLFLPYVFFIFLAGIILVDPLETSNSSTIMEVNLVGFSSGTISPEVGIEVPNFLSLGNLSMNDPYSDEKTIYINNTGKLDITITPQLKDPNDMIFSNLFFRSYKESNDETLNIFKRIGEFKLDIDKPATGKIKRPGHCYTQLNLTGNENVIEEDVIGYRGEIIFVAMAR